MMIKKFQEPGLTARSCIALPFMEDSPTTKSSRQSERFVEFSSCLEEEPHRTAFVRQCLNCLHYRPKRGSWSCLCRIRISKQSGLDGLVRFMIPKSAPRLCCIGKPRLQHGPPVAPHSSAAGNAREQVSKTHPFCKSKCPTPQFLPFPNDGDVPFWSHMLPHSNTTQEVETRTSGIRLRHNGLGHSGPTSSPSVTNIIPVTQQVTAWSCGA
ncbi:hypothetical protein BJV78DRAFT_1245716 [Lactifluus subvellereus]|nr:hypothetical protein BJV78DRAFT_1245716 [Lactifluus subvellereus]